ncbi:MAG: S41 family peptidase, partial [Phycisphaerales bacterium]
MTLAGCRHAGNHDTQPLTGDSPIVAPSAPESAPSIETALAVETFDAAWQLINDTHFDPNHNGVDWLAVRDEFGPQAETATTERELRQVIGEMLARLEQSHFALLPREAVDALDPEKLAASDAPQFEQSKASDEAEEDVQSRPGDSGLEVRIVDQDIVVRNIQAGGSAEEAGVKPGWVVKRIGAIDLADLFGDVPEHLERRMARFYIWRTVTVLLEGDAGDEVEVEFLNELNEPIQVPLSRRPVPGKPVKFGNLPTFFAHLESEEMIDEDGTTVGVIRFNIWMTAIAKPFHEAIDQFRSADGIVIDLRGNPGGVGGMAMGIAGHFVNEKTTLGTLTTRNTELKFILNP